MGQEAGMEVKSGKVERQTQNATTPHHTSFLTLYLYLIHNECYNSLLCQPKEPISQKNSKEPASTASCPEWQHHQDETLLKDDAVLVAPAFQSNCFNNEAI
jgi:hypothetical protein